MVNLLIMKVFGGPRITTSMRRLRVVLESSKFQVSPFCHPDICRVRAVSEVVLEFTLRQGVIFEALKFFSTPYATDGV